VPELPEVEFCGRALVRWTAGRRVVGHVLRDGRSVRARREDRPTVGLDDGAARLDAVFRAPPGEPERRGKRLLWPFGEAALLLHLGMTGKWTRGDEPRHAKLGLRLDDGAAIWFSDPRLLGGVVPTTLAAGRVMLGEGLGPDALLDGLPPLRGRRAVKVALLDQASVAGLGNLHAAEALWRAGIHPATPCDALDAGAWRTLALAVSEQLRWALESFGDEDLITYVEESGAPNPFPLYQRGGEPCPRCRTPIGSFVQAGRTTWWCPGCQPAPSVVAGTAPG